MLPSEICLSPSSYRKWSYTRSTNPASDYDDLVLSKAYRITIRNRTGYMKLKKQCESTLISSHMYVCKSHMYLQYKYLTCFFLCITKRQITSLTTFVACVQTLRLTSHMQASTIVVNIYMTFRPQECKIVLRGS